MFCFDSGQERVVAVLHDVLEDSGVTALDFEMAGFDRDVIEVVQFLTRRIGEDYMDFVDRVAKNPLASRVKVQDILDNLKVGQLQMGMTDVDLDRIEKYHKALLLLRNLI